MAYGNIYPNAYPQYFPNAYNPQMNVAQTQQAVNPTQPQSNIVWVSGEAGAKAYLVAPNTTVQLWDSEAQTIYLKSADASGMPTMKILDYVIREAQAQNAPVLMQDNIPEYVAKSDFDAFVEKVQKQFDKISVKKRKEEYDDE